jgi:hypothetical protein
VDWLPWVIGVAVVALYAIPICHDALRRRVGYRCLRCHGRARFTGRSSGFKELGCSSYTCPNCGGVFWEVFGRLRTEKPGFKGLTD